MLSFQTPHRRRSDTPNTRNRPAILLSNFCDASRTSPTSTHRVPAGAANSTSSRRRAPHYYLTIEVDATRLVQLRSDVNAALELRGDKTKVSYNDLVMRACVVALEGASIVAQDAQLGVADLHTREATITGGQELSTREELVDGPGDDSSCP
ncbi:MAG TPA: 2-oxo acid dehydrogenase subunit E2, partial [Bryobacteraceae bacterium]|nr:2-oxo acid dehydrogenase subunit E2 [Bryobacteraceae bacterium]